jgi:plasmid stabilization system protein ParE
MRIRWLDRAERDVTGLLDYLLERNLLAARRVYAAIREQVGRLAEHPEAGRAGRVAGTRETELAMTIEQSYEEAIRGLPIEERIRLASLIMWDSAGEGKIDYSEEWTEQDLREFSAAGWDLIERRMDEGGDEGGRGRTR